MNIPNQSHERKSKIEEAYPLSPMQQGMLFHSLLAPGSGVDIEQLVCELHEALDVIALQRSWQCVIARHPVLRTNFRWQGLDEPQQEVHSVVALPWEEQDWRDVPPGEKEKRLAVFLRSDRRRGFDMARAPLLRLTLFHWDDADSRLIWTFHHALLDGRSFAPALREVFAFYEAFRRGEERNLPLPRPYRDYIDWLQQQDFSGSEAFWRQTLKDFTAPTPLAVDRPPSTEGDDAILQGDQEIRLSTEITTTLRSLASENQLTLNTVVQGAWALLLSRYSGEADVVFGATRACRRSSVEGAETMMGLFINTLPVRVQVNPEASLLPWLKQLRAQWVAMREHEHAPLVKVQGWSEARGGVSLFESIVVFENFHLDTLLRMQGGSWANRQFRLFEKTNYPITLDVYDGTELCLKLEFDRSRFDDATIARLLGHLRTLLEAMAGHPRHRLGDLPLLTPGERHQLLVEWNQTKTDYPRDKCLHQLFETQVERTPDAVAVVFEGEQLTYRQLNQRANQLAHYLRSLGAGPDAFVGVCLERSLEMVVALYGVLKAGAAYVPIDPDYPRELVAFMLEDANTPVLLTQQRLAGDLPAHGARLVCLDTAWPTISQQSDQNPVGTATADNLSYMIYTSGSTGKPKGAMNTHRGICNRLLWMQERYQLAPADTVMQKTPFSFDVSVWEFFWPLLNGAKLVVARPGGHQDPAYLVSLIEQHNVTVLHFVPSMLRVFLEKPGVERCRSLRHVICSGEALGFDLQERFFEQLSAQLHNLYGPTEAAVDVTHWSCQRNSPLRFVPIGRPVANTQTYILDTRMQPVPVGVAGELYLGGAQIGRGYHNRPELTAEKFVPDPFSTEPGARLYRTGDLARFLPDGNIEYVGRLDHQVKIRGFRVELGEIESVLLGHPAVREAVAMVREDVPGDRRLVAYLTAKEGEPPTVSELRGRLQAKLPDYMVPSAFVTLDRFPLTPNGKLDRKALPAPQDAGQRLGDLGPLPRNEMERTIAAIWQKVLHLEKVGVEDGFFDLGGHSLHLVQIQNRLEKVLNRPLSTMDLFRYPTISSLARYLSEKEKATAPQVESGEQVQRVQAGKKRLTERFKLRRPWESLGPQEKENRS